MGGGQPYREEGEDSVLPSPFVQQPQAGRDTTLCILIELAAGFNLIPSENQDVAHVLPSKSRYCRIVYT